MRWMLGLGIWSVALLAHADTSTLRVGSQVLVAGDSTARVVELLGKPAQKTHGKAAKPHGKSSPARGHAQGRAVPTTEPRGEQWQYRVEGRLVTVMVSEGRVASFRDGGR